MQTQGSLPTPLQRHDSRPAAIRNTVRLIVVLDKSLSMADSEAQVTEALRGFVSTLQSMPGPQRYLATLVTFAGEAETVILAEPLEKLSVQYRADGEGTALYDAIAFALSLEKTRTEQVVCVIVSDGDENCSQEATEQQIVAMVTARRELGNWIFIWLSLNSKPNKTARALGIQCIATRRENVARALPQVAERIGCMAARLAGSTPLRAIEGGRR
jgi:hypothetical protein